MNQDALQMIESLLAEFSAPGRIRTRLLSIQAAALASERRAAGLEGENLELRSDDALNVAEAQLAASQARVAELEERARAWRQDIASGLSGQARTSSYWAGRAGADAEQMRELLKCPPEEHLILDGVKRVVAKLNSKVEECSGCTRLALSEAIAWLPIESAPKDTGAERLRLSDGSTTLGYWSTKRGAWWDGNVVLVNVTHWQPAQPTVLEQLKARIASLEATVERVTTHRDDLGQVVTKPPPPAELVERWSLEAEQMPELQLRRRIYRRCASELAASLKAHAVDLGPIEALLKYSGLLNSQDILSISPNQLRAAIAAAKAFNVQEERKTK